MNVSWETQSPLGDGVDGVGPWAVVHMHTRRKFVSRGCDALRRCSGGPITVRRAHVSIPVAQNARIPLRKYDDSFSRIIDDGNERVRPPWRESPARGLSSKFPRGKL